MDARQYLARKGLDGKAPSTPQRTLEEKAWARARQSGHRKPRAGTPHDWEDWERYHDDLADGAERLVQKVDPEEHAVSSSASTRQNGSDARDQVESISPTSDEHKTISSEDRPRAQPFVAFVALAVVLPPLAVGLSGGGARRVTISLALTLLGWLPGMAHAFYWLSQR